MAFIVGSVIGGVAALAGGLIEAHGASQAAKAQENAANTASQTQLEMFHEAQGMSAPSRNLGYGADTKLAQLFGIDPATLTNSSYSSTPNGGGQGSGQGVPIPGTGPRGGGRGDVRGGSGGYFMTPHGLVQGVTTGANGAPNMSSTGGGTTPGSQSGQSSTPGGTPDYSGFYNSPGFQFARGLGQQSIDRSQAAGGGLYSVNTQTLESQYNTGFASQHYNDYVQQLLNMAGMGSGSATAGGSQAVQTGQGVSNNIISGGNAAAAGSIGQAGAITGAIGGAYNAYRQYAGSQSPPTFDTNSMQNSGVNSVSSGLGAAQYINP